MRSTVSGSRWWACSCISSEVIVVGGRSEKSAPEPQSHPLRNSEKIQGILLVLPSAAARVWVGVRTELRDEGEEEHDTVAVRRQPRLHRMACAQPTHR